MRPIVEASTHEFGLINDSSPAFTASCPLIAYLFSLWLNSIPFPVTSVKAMEFLSAVFGLFPCLYDHTSEHTGYIHDLKENLESLKKVVVELDNLYEDVKTRVKLAEQQQMIPRREVDGWLVEVENMKEEVNGILQKGDQEMQRLFFGCCSRNCWSSYKIGKKVSQKLQTVSCLMNKGHFNVVADTLHRGRVDQMPMENTVGLDLIYKRVCNCFKDPEVGVIGLYGMGGVGKTTLLKKINNQILALFSNFDVVIWAVVSKPANVEKVQEDIRNKLQIPDSIWTSGISKDGKAAKIFQILSTKRFVLLLDDIWERLDLLQVGIPLPDGQNKSKLVFTTRSEHVCNQMKAQKRIKVECLEPDLAWTLFKQEVGEETLSSHPHILPLAEAVAKECKGLPLALIVTGRATASMKTPSDWEAVVRDLREYPTEISGMEDELFYRLKFSYDRLGNKAIKSCFLYCALFPEDYAIENDKLTELWIREGFLGEVHDIFEARSLGYKIIRDLKFTCLLESSNVGDERVKMHDVIRDMALWLTNKCGKQKNNFLIYQPHGLIEVQEVAKWSKSERISLWDRDVGELSNAMVDCPNLKTLFVRQCLKLETFPVAFFQLMPLLRVLDLSNNHNLTELPPEICKLGTLEYLDLSSTSIRSLPLEFENLKNLKSLFLNMMASLDTIPTGVISNLSSLQLLSMYHNHGTCKSVVDEILLEELDCLNGLNEISFSMYSAYTVRKFMTSYKSQRCIRLLHLSGCSGLISLELSSSVLERMKRLERLYISKCERLEDIKINLQREGRQGVEVFGNFIVTGNHFQKLHIVELFDCPKFLELTWLIHAPFLQLLTVDSCSSIERVVSDDHGVSEITEKLGIFSRLKHLCLMKLPRLLSIYPNVLLFPSLETILVSNCEKLRRLPFDSNTASNSLKIIEGEESWWNELQWENETIKQLFIPYFQAESDYVRRKVGPSKFSQRGH